MWRRRLFAVFMRRCDVMDKLSFQYKTPSSFYSGIPRAHVAISANATAFFGREPGCRGLDEFIDRDLPNEKPRSTAEAHVNNYEESNDT